MRARVRPKRPSGKAVRNQLAWLGGGTTMEQTRKTGRQAEGLVNDAIAEWAQLHSELVIGRNKRRLATPPGMSQPIMLGLLIDGSSDWIGYRSFVIRPEHVGARIAQFVALESKRPDGGVLSLEQRAFLKAVQAAGGVASVVRSASDAEDALALSWTAGMAKGE